MEKYANYILLILVGVVLFMMYKTNKMMNLMLTMQMGMAKKMGILEDEPGTKAQEQRRVEEPSEKDQKKIEAEILRLAQKLYAGSELTGKKEKDFYEQHKVEINKQTFTLLQEDLIRISDMIENKQEISREDADHYKDKFEKYKDHLKLAELTDDIPIKEAAADTGGKKRDNDIVSPATEAERLHVMLSLFDDGSPKTTTEIKQLYAEKTNTQPSGNTGKLLDKLLENKKLKNQQIQCGNPKRKKVYWGLHAWFEGNKFSKEFMTKIPK